jgi:hypothetical protein
VRRPTALPPLRSNGCSAQRQRSAGALWCCVLSTKTATAHCSWRGFPGGAPEGDFEKSTRQLASSPEPQNLNFERAEIAGSRQGAANRALDDGRSPSRWPGPQCPAQDSPPGIASVGVRLDRLHVVVRQAEMMSDFMDQHMGNDGAQRLVMLTPVVEDRPAVQPDYVWHVQRRAFGAER